MPYLDTESVIKKYWEKVKDQYPNIPYEQFERICKAPFWFIKSQIEKKETPTIHVMNFGKFIVLSSYVKRLISRNNKKLEKGNIPREEWEERDKALQAKLKEVLISEAKNTEDEGED